MIKKIIDKLLTKQKKVEETKQINLLGRISDKISPKYKRDYMLLSKNSAYLLMDKMVSRGIGIMCDINDRDGRISEKIVSIEGEYGDFCIKTKRGRYRLQDRFLYNLIYISKKSEYSLQEHDEYYEKIEMEK
jgi:hypothetical protein